LIRVNIQPSAEAEADEAAAWYEVQQPGLGIEFLLELDAAIERAAETPVAYGQIHREVRRVLVRRFPYAVYFLFEGELVEVFAGDRRRRVRGRFSQWSLIKCPLVSLRRAAGERSVGEGGESDD
jgi:plasmid stabilization system protein ParE